MYSGSCIRFLKTGTNAVAKANAETIYKALVGSFTRRNVPLTNMIGFGSIGDNDSVKTRLLRD